MEYEALISKMILVLEMGTFRLKAKTYSQMIVNQVFRKYQVKDPELMRYLPKVLNLSSHFSSFEIKHIPREQIFKEYLLSKLATPKMTWFNKTTI